MCFPILFLLCLCALLFIYALWPPTGKGQTSWLLFVVSNCEFVTFPSLSWVRCVTWLYPLLVFAPFLTLIIFYWQKFNFSFLFCYNTNYLCFNLLKVYIKIFLAHQIGISAGFFISMRNICLTYPVPTRGKDKKRTAAHSGVIVILIWRHLIMLHHSLFRNMKTWYLMVSKKIIYCLCENVWDFGLDLFLLKPTIPGSK